MMLSLYGCVLFLILPWYGQGQASCEVCEGAEVCFGSGACASCDASDACTGVCEGCASAGPCRACFELPPEPAPWPVQVDEIPCDYAVDKVEANLVRGEIPTWLTGTFYHAQHTNAPHMGYDGNLANPSGILSVTFGMGDSAGGGVPIVSYDSARGTGWQWVCQSPPTPPFVQDCVVTVNQFGGSLASVCASGNLAQFATDDSGSVTFDGALELTWKDSTIEDTWPYGRECDGQCPKNLQPEHMPIDANGDVYSLYYTYEKPGYRIFKLAPGSTERVEVAWIPSVHDTPSYTHMGPVPTSNYIILIEPPLPHDVNYNWAGMQANFNPDEPVTVYVIDKNDDSGEVIAQYTTDQSFWSWHVANAWEDCDTGEVHVDVTRDPNAHTFQSFYNSTGGDWTESSLVRITLSDPKTAGLNGRAATTILDTVGLGVEFPVTQDQYQFGTQTGHYWMAGARTDDDRAFPLVMSTVLKYDVESGTTMHTWEPDGLSMGEPYFIPKEKDQGPMNDEGAVVVIAMNATGHLFGAILDGTDLTELALFEIPMVPVPSFGLHSFYSTASTWVSTPTECEDPAGDDDDDDDDGDDGTTPDRPVPAPAGPEEGPVSSAASITFASGVVATASSAIITLW